MSATEWDRLENFAESGYCPGCHVAIDLHPWLEADPDAIRCPTAREALDALYRFIGTTSQSDKQVTSREAEDRLLRYIGSRGAVKASEAVNAVGLQRYSMSTTIVRAALWRLVNLQKLSYRWDGWISLPGGVLPPP